MKKIVRANIVLGQPLPFSLYDESGRLLLRRGIVITMPDQIDRLLARGALRDELEPPLESGSALLAQPTPAPARSQQTPFEQFGSLTLNLKHVLGTTLSSPQQIDVGARVRKIALAIQDLCQQDIDSTLAASCLDFQNPYLIVHQMMGAVLTEIVARRTPAAKEQRLSWVCAALTRDLGQWTIQSELDQHAGSLPPALQSRMREHPDRSAELLARAGVVDLSWLAAVRGHHERLNGSGYPAGLKDEQIGLGARILSVTDMYSAMQKSRPYRKQAHFPQNALKEIYQRKDGEIDGEMAQILIGQIGLLPPGTIVRLTCGEIAVIKSPSLKADGATVYSIYGKTGMVLPAPLRRETSQPGYEITGLLPFAECRSASVTLKRVWTQ